jgi:archaellum component FlaC
MTDKHGFSDREAGRIENRLQSLEDSVEGVSDQMDQFMEDDYDDVKSQVQTHRNWLKIIWGLISTLGAGLMTVFLWVMRGRIG